MTPLLAAASGGKAEMVRLLLQRGADVNFADKVGLQPIMDVLR